MRFLQIRRLRMLKVLDASVRMKFREFVVHIVHVLAFVIFPLIVRLSWPRSRRSQQNNFQKYFICIYNVTKLKIKKHIYAHYTIQYTKERYVAKSRRIRSGGTAGTRYARDEHSESRNLIPTTNQNTSRIYSQW